MSIKPFSVSELESITKIFEQLKWSHEGRIEDQLRYSLKKEKLFVLTIKHPITLPVRLNIPFEVVTFKVALAFQLWNFNQKTTNILIILLKMLQQLAEQLSLQHNFPLKGREPKLLSLLNTIIPETIKNELESTWLNRIRISLMNKREEFSTFDNEKVKEIVDTLEDNGLEPSFNQPWELEKGLPKFRTSETLFFSNDEPFDEFFILEKGFFTYFKDIEYQKFYIRTSFDSYTPYILNSLFEDEPGFKIGVFIENWIKFSRLILNSIIEIINTAELNQTEFVQFNHERELQKNDQFEFNINNFPLSPLRYEGSLSKELFPLHNDLFNTPPTSFEVVESINYYTDAEEMIKNYKFDEATKILNECLKIFNKHKQKKVVVSVLFLLSKIAFLLNQDNVAINYMQNALGIAKSGEVPIDYIMRVHYKLGKTFFNLKNYDKAHDHFNIIVNFLENEQSPSKTNKHLGLAYVYQSIILHEQNKVPESKATMKKAMAIGKNIPRVRLKYFLKRAIYLKNRGNVSQAQKLLKMGVEAAGDLEDKENRNIKMDIMMELAEFYIHKRKDKSKSFHYLKVIETLTSVKTIQGIQRAVRWNLLMADFYNFLVKNQKNQRYYLRQSQILKSQLNTIGVLI